MSSRVAHTYLDPEHAVVAVLTPRPSGEPAPRPRALPAPSCSLRSMRRRCRCPPWAESAPAGPDVAALGRRVHPVDTTLPNGLRLLVQPTLVSWTVSIDGHVPAMSRTSRRRRGRKAWTRCWTGSSGTAPARSIGSRSSVRSTSSVPRRPRPRTSRSRCCADHVARAVALLADHVMHPRLPEDAFRTVRAQLAAELSPSRLASPEYRAKRALLEALLPPNDPHAPPGDSVDSRVAPPRGRPRVPPPRLPPRPDDDRRDRADHARGGTRRYYAIVR